MTLHWPDEDIGLPGRLRSGMDGFFATYRDLPNRVEAGRLLHASDARQRDSAAEAAVLEADHPAIAARIRVEADEPYLHTAAGLRAEAALADAAGLPPVAVVERLGRASSEAVSCRLIADALMEDGLRSQIIKGLRAAFAAPPVFDGDEGESGPYATAEEARNAIRESREVWGHPNKRSLRTLRMDQQAATYLLLVPLAHCVIAPLSRAAPEAAVELLDAMPSPLDAALCLDLVRLDVERFEPWSRAVRCAPRAWDAAGWIGTRGPSHALALPLLLWSAEEHLVRMPADPEPDRAAPENVAAVLRDRDDGTVAAWRWCAELIGEADRRERDGRGGPQDGVWRTAQALAAGGGWSEFDPGRGSDALVLEAAKRLAAEPPASPPHLASLVPSSPEAFLDGPAGTDLSWAAFGLAGGFGPMFEDRPPYGLATRILSSSLWGTEGPERLRALWHDALVLRELAAGGVTRDMNDDPADRRDPANPLHLIIALGMASVEMSGQGGGGDAPRLLAEVDAMLAEIRPWDLLGHDALLKSRQALPGNQPTAAQ